MLLVDTNIIAYLLIESEWTAKARALFEKDDDWQSEEFVLAEFVNILATYSRSNMKNLSEASGLLEKADRIFGPNLHFIENKLALETSLEFRITGYDARFIAAAKRLGTPLVTEDKRLRDAVPQFTQSITQALLREGS